jgi:putative membrane protein
MNGKRIVAALLVLLFWTARVYAQEPSLTDEQMLGVVFVANQAEIAAANLALRKTRSNSLQVYAKRIVSEHAQVNQEIMTLTQRFGTEPQRSATSDALTKQSNSEIAELDETSTYDFDEAYLEHEIVSLQKLVRTVEGYIRTARSADARTLLIRSRPSFIFHLDQAQRLQITIGSPGLVR